MRPGVLFLLLSFCLFILSCGSETAVDSNSAAAPAAPSAKPPRDREPVLVELFTSEGCGNCPPDDKQLAFLETQQPVQGADVITLGYHVDYFNDRGWRDVYSSPEYTRRQNLYAMRMSLDSIYTPQMIVDGRTQFIGSDPTKANDEISKAASKGKAVVDVKVNGNTADVTITGIGTHLVATAVLATAEDELVSNVNAGNNKGRTLQHISVVRKLQGFGKVPERATEFKGTVELPSNSAWKAENVRHVVYVQEDQSGRIIAVGRVKTA
jgi:hypothetical protein